MQNMLINSVKKHVVEIGNQIYHHGLAPGKSGNISAKIPYDKSKTPYDTSAEIPYDSRYIILITPSGVSLKDISMENIIAMDMDGNQLEGHGRPSSELPMHREIYQKRGDLRGIVHTHSPYATGFSFSGKKIPRLEGFGKIENPYITEMDYAPPGSKKLAELAGQALLKEDVVILKNHGVLAVGSNLDEAALLAEFTESSAKTAFVAHVLNAELK